MGLIIPGKRTNMQIFPIGRQLNLIREGSFPHLPLRGLGADPLKPIHFDTDSFPLLPPSTLKNSKRSFMHSFFATQFKVTPAMLDQNGHVNNVVYVNWMQDVAIEHGKLAGFAGSLGENSDVGWAARSHHIHYRHPAYLDDSIVAVTWIAKARRVGCQRKYHFQLSNPAGNLVSVVEAETEWVFVNRNSGRPTQIPADSRERIKVLPQEPNIEEVQSFISKLR